MEEKVSWVNEKKIKLIEIKLLREGVIKVFRLEVDKKGD